MASVNDNLKTIQKDRDANKRMKAYQELGDQVETDEDLKAMQNAWNKEKEKSKLESTYEAALAKIEKRIGSSERQYTTTSAREVNKESEDALNFKLQETQEGKVNLFGEEKTAEITTKGKLIAKNLGEKDRIWDIDIKFNNVGKTNLEENYLIQELSPQEEWTKEYEVTADKVNAENVNDVLPFEFKEIINTQSQQEGANPDEPNTVLVFGKEMQTKVKYVFKAKKALSTITVEKEILGHFTKSDVATTSVGEGKIEGEKLTWTIEKLDEGQEATMEFSSIIDVKDVEPKRSGKVNVKAVSNVEGALSGADFGKADGLTKNYVSIDADEQAEAPDTWQCKLVVENPSEFPIELHSVKVSAATEDGTGETYIEQEFEESQAVIPPGGSWTTPETWTVESADVPKFKKFVFLTVKPEIMYIAESVISYEDMEMPVAKLAAAKKFGVSQLPSFRATPVPTMIRVANTGSLQLKETTITDLVPPGMEPPSTDEVKVFVVPAEGETLSDEVPTEKKAQIKDFSVEFTSGDKLDSTTGEPLTCEGAKDGGEAHIMKVVITRPIEPNEVIYVDYSPIAQKPKEGDNFTAPGHLKAELSVPAPPLELDVVDYIGGEGITVVHQRRAITTGKQVFPGSDVGVYEIILRFKNRGDVELKDLKIRDFVPDSFEIQEESQESESASGDEGKIHTWTVETLNAGDQAEIKYTIKGSGEYKVGKAQSSYS